ncbi:MAG TPA: PEP/pyruvate-binding domain-containing protein [Acidimicrobiales bacterium]|nr:PEP/pyruvate-binding domain-containing protein [Acidimicrobiales bacterium]
MANVEDRGDGAGVAPVGANLGSRRIDETAPQAQGRVHPPVPDNARRTVLCLDDEDATEPNRSGAKAAALAEALAVGLPVLPGFVISTAATASIDRDTWAGAVGDEIRRVWATLSEGGERALVVRSSSTVEDLGDSSMAGRFSSVVGVRGWDEFCSAVRTVLDSRRKAAEGDGALAADQPMAVVVQPLLEPAAGGVMFGVDPVTGRSDRIVVSTVAGGPDKLVSGEVDGSRYELDRAGDVHAVDHRPSGARLDRRQLRRLAELADQVQSIFGEPQDVEWAVDDDERLWLLQSRPVTTPVRGVPSGPLLGAGPVAETFPEPLTTLEEDLWAEPLRDALRSALRVTGTASPRKLRDSPVVVSLEGGVAVDLELFGETDESPSLGGRLDPRPRLRRLRAAWRVGRLRSALPDLAHHVIERTDAELTAVPPLDDLTDRQLVALLDRCRQALRSLHGHEVLVGLVVDPGAPRLTGASVALRVLSEARAEGLDDGEVVSRHPVVLALVPPHVQPSVSLPPIDAPPPAADADGAQTDRCAVLREALRLRVRWVQELTGRAAWVLGERLTEAGRLGDPVLVRHLRLEELRALVAGRAELRRDRSPERDDQPVPEPLPARFRLSDRGHPVPVIGTGDQAGTGAGGGVAVGPVDHGPEPEEGAVLVVRTLDPSLAATLPRLAGLVAETGSVLAHVAILAREAGVPTVVGLSGAVERFPPGTVVRVDGASGEVTPVDEEES